MKSIERDEVNVFLCREEGGEGRGRPREVGVGKKKKKVENARELKIKNHNIFLSLDASFQKPKTKTTNHHAALPDPPRQRGREEGCPGEEDGPQVRGCPQALAVQVLR